MTAVPTSALTYDWGWERTICQIYCYSFLATEANSFKHSTSWPVQITILTKTLKKQICGNLPLIILFADVNTSGM